MQKKHSLIIGGTKGTGRALVKMLSEEGHILSIIGRHPSEADRHTANTYYRAADINDRERLEASLSEIISRNGKLNNLIFLQRYRGKEDDWAGEMETSLTATKNIIEYLTDEFETAMENSIVIVSSLASRFIAEEQPVSYHVAKAGLNQMVCYYAVALGSKGIRVNSVSPGTILKEESEDFYVREGLYDLYKTITPLGRMVTPEDIVQIIIFLCSSNASFITGQDIVVDGGLSLRLQASLAHEIALSAKD